MEKPMSDYHATISDALYEEAQRVAQQTSRPVDDVIRSMLEGALDQPLVASLVRRCTSIILIRMGMMDWKISVWPVETVT